MSLESLRGLLPDYAKDLKLNLSSLASETTLTQQQLAEKLLLTRNYIAKIESDAQEPAARVVRDLESLRVAFENSESTPLSVREEHAEYGTRNQKPDAAALRRASHQVVAQFIVVSREEDPSLASTVERTGAEFVKAPVSSSRAQMCDLGMSRATGSIVAVRDDVAVGDARWLDTYLAVLPRAEVTLTVPAESLVMDTTLIAGSVLRADSAQHYAKLDKRAGTAAVESAAPL